MNTTQLALLRIWAEGNQKSLEWKVGDRTFQISGVRGSEGCFERFFGRGLHPTRKIVTDAEVLDALANATDQIKFWHNDTDIVCFENAGEALDAAKRWVSQGG
jgi:hypothetical protein